MGLTNTLVDIPEIGLEFQRSTVIDKALTFVAEHCDVMTFNHAVRSAYFAAIVVKKLPSFVSVDLEAVIVSSILHDLGWSTTPSLISDDQRFEVDSANVARDFLNTLDGSGADAWDAGRIQRCWYAIALHTTPSIGRFAEPLVTLTGMGILADFMGPAFPNGPGKENLITLEEYSAVIAILPRGDFTVDGMKRIMCGFCRSKPATTYDNFVSVFGRRFGMDGQGDGKEEFTQSWEDNQMTNHLLQGLENLDKLKI